MAEQTRNEKKKKGGGGAAVGIVALLALLGGGGYFGLGVGNPNGGLLPVNQTTQAPQPAVTTEAPKEVTTEAPESTTEDSVLSIIVKESGILYEGRSVTLTELEKALLSDFANGKEVQLSDDHAKKADYDAVETLLKQLTIPFTVK